MVTASVIQHLGAFEVITPGGLNLFFPPCRCLQAINGDVTINLAQWVSTTGETGNIIEQIGRDFVLREGQFVYGNFTQLQTDAASAGDLLVYLQ